MNEARVEELGLKPLEAELAAIDRLQTKTDLARYFARMFKLNLINPLVGFVDGDAQQPDREILYVHQGGLGLARPRLLPARTIRSSRSTARSTSRFSRTLLTLAKQPRRTPRRRTSSRSRRAWRARTGPTSRAAMR